MSPQYLRLDVERTDYTVSEGELIEIESSAHNYWKNICLITVSLGIPCILNAIKGTTKDFNLTLFLFLNYLIGILALTLALIFGIGWFRTRNKLCKIMDKIKNKTKFIVDSPIASGTNSLTIVLRQDKPEEDQQLTPT